MRPLLLAGLFLLAFQCGVFAGGQKVPMEGAKSILSIDNQSSRDIKITYDVADYSNASKADKTREFRETVIIAKTTWTIEALSKDAVYSRGGVLFYHKDKNNAWQKLTKKRQIRTSFSSRHIDGIHYDHRVKHSPLSFDLSNNLEIIYERVFDEATERHELKITIEDR